MDPFLLEIYFAKHEFSAKYLLCCSDSETMSMKDLLALADEECRILWENCMLGYTETAGHPKIRQEICNVFYSGMNVEHVHCFCGAEEAIFATFQSLLVPGDEVICITPAYQSLLSIPESIVLTGGGKIVKIDLEMNWTLDIHRVHAAITNKTKMLIINFPHNPTGALISASQQKEIIDLCKKHDLILFSDEVYRGQEHSESDRLPPACVLYEKAISLGVVSKSLGLAGLRIGWICCKDTSMLQKIAAYKHYLSICNSAPSEILALISLRNYNIILGRNRKIMLDNVKAFEIFLRRHSNLFEWDAPKGGCVAFVRYKGAGSLEALSEVLVNEHGVLLLPGSQFPGSVESYDSYFRLGFGRLSFCAALNVLEEALSKMNLEVI